MVVDGTVNEKKVSYVDPEERNLFDVTLRNIYAYMPITCHLDLD